MTEDFNSESTADCESCRSDQGSLFDADDGAPAPYRLCDDCKSRLLSYSLRPREWFNLAKLYSPHRYHIGSDFYEDDGTAAQPKKAVNQPEAHPFPLVGMAQFDPQLAVDIAITKWNLEKETELLKILQQHGSRLLPAVEAASLRTDYIDVHDSLLEIAARAIGPIAAEWVRSENRRFNPKLLHRLAQAFSRCLPLTEGLETVKTALFSLPAPIQRDASLALAWFRSETAIPFLSQIVASPVTDAWGRALACCDLSWPVVVQWLERGRPHSLVALDALAAIISPDTSTLLELRPNLRQPPSNDDLRSTLNGYAEIDAVPRVKSCVTFILENSELLARLP